MRVICNLTMVGYIIYIVYTNTRSRDTCDMYYNTGHSPNYNPYPNTKFSSTATNHEELINCELHPEG